MVAAQPWSLVERRYNKMTVHPRLVAIIDRIRQVDGQGLAEYALILALIAIISIVSLIFLGSQVSDKMSVIGSHLQSVSH
jgi:Flp pilus assembly pilin Flp